MISTFVIGKLMTRLCASNAMPLVEAKSGTTKRAGIAKSATAKRRLSNETDRPK